jgi:hypothetical protein
MIVSKHCDSPSRSIIWCQSRPLSRILFLSFLMSASNLFRAWGNLMAAAGWYVSIYSMPAKRGTRQATRPMSTMIRGAIRLISFSRTGIQRLISSALGFLFPGVGSLTAAVIYNVFLSRPLRRRTLFKYCPDLPTKGRPCFTSSLPGFWPTSMMSASEGPSAKRGAFVFRQGICGPRLTSLSKDTRNAPKTNEDHPPSMP